MSKRTLKGNPKEIIALDNFDAIRRRSDMYCGQIAEIEDKAPIILDNTLTSQTKKWSPGFYQLFIEIFENALDEAKRCKGKMKSITVKVNLDNNEITIIDEGLGFHNAAKKHKKTKKNVVRTALEELHAGSNFTDASTNMDAHIIGLHGIGSSVVNILSERFSVDTVNKTHYVHFIWNDFKVVDEQIRKKTSADKMGTKISLIPSRELFSNYKWDIDLISTYLSYKYFLIKNDSHIHKLELKAYLIKDNKEENIKLSYSFLPKDSIVVSNNFGTIYLWEAYENSCSLSFINGSQCYGIHQKIVNDWCNDYFKYPYAHHFYETLISLNVSSNLLRFADQNKTKFATARNEIEETMVSSFQTKLIRLLSKSDIARSIERTIEDRLHSENIGKIRKAQKQSKRKISDKFTPASRYKDVVYLTEGNSAAGAVKQARDPESDAVYALRGKVKNARKLSDLTTSEGWLDIMSILDIEPGNDKSPIYNKIVIASDSDADGSHITSLIINFFFKWFPQIIENKKLYQLITPLVVCDFEKKRKYFYTLEQFEQFTKDNKVSNINYLKGLGSLCPDDWQYVMKHKTFFSVIDDKSANKYLEIAFSDDSNKRKKWLQNG
jgi:DNA gyrase/topoisomerase IV subunit B